MSRKSLRVLVVEDDPVFLSVISGYLELAGFTVLKAGTGQQFYQRLEREQFDLVLLDLNLPDEDGLVLARRLRAKSDLPIIIVTGRNDQEDRNAGLEIGADDYLIKPFDPKELLLRVRNLMRRCRGENWKPPEALVIGEWTLDFDRRMLSHQTGQEVALSAAEFDLLATLARANGRVLSRDQLSDAVSSGKESRSGRAIDMLVSRVRNKIGDNPQDPHLLITVPGHGYRLARPMQPDTEGEARP